MGSAEPTSACSTRAGDDAGGRSPRGDRAADDGALARRRPQVLRRRPSRRALPPRRLPLQAPASRPRRRCSTRRWRSPSAPAAVRPAARRHPRLALPLPPPPARLRGTREDVERALELAQAMEDRRRSRTPTTRPRSLPSAWATGCSRGTTQSRPASPGASSRTNGTWASCSRTWEAQPHARQPRAGDRAPGPRSRSRSRWTRRKTPRRRPVHWPLFTSTRRLRRRRVPCPSRSHCSEIEDYLHEIGPTQLVLGRAMLERGRLDEAEQWFRAADTS